jgi:hypothetical protein
MTQVIEHLPSKQKAKQTKKYNYILFIGYTIEIQKYK